ncbi:MAG: RHS repeat-associated core domain-containing protein [Phycisphaerae bacterium]|nr:RHS repeat-associated core domain-containing protein [Phycisphaerae bacterium]
MIHTCQRRGPDEALSACWRTSAAGARGHDAVGRRVETVEYWDAQEGPLDPPRHTRHVYDGLQAVEEYMCEAATCGWSLAREFFWGGRFPEPIAMIDHTAAGLLPANQPEVLHYLHDVLGSVIGLTNSAGTLVERYSYDPYGKTLVERRDPLTGSYELNGADGNFPTWSAFGNPFMWTAQRYDATIGLYHFKYRTYNPVWGRWHQQDPLGYVDGVNLYECVASNPLFWIDPFGLAKIIISVDSGGRAPSGSGSSKGGYGHTWIDVIDDDGTRTGAGFYPGGDGAGKEAVTGKTYPGDYNDDTSEKHHYDDKFEYDVSQEEANKTKEKIKDHKDENPDWSLKHNCTSFACDVAREAGIDIDRDKIRTLGWDDPAKLLKYLREQREKRDKEKNQKDKTEPADGKKGNGSGQTNHDGASSSKECQGNDSK